MVQGSSDYIDQPSIKVLPVLQGLFPLDYALPESLSLESLTIGTLVIISVRNKEALGIIWDLKSKIDVAYCSSTVDSLKNPKIFKLKEIKSVLNLKIDSLSIELIKRSAAYYLTELGTAAKAMLPLNSTRYTKFLSIKFFTQELLPSKFNLNKLSEEQEKAFLQIQNFVQASSNINRVKPCLLYGVTGAGKTEVYLHLISEILKQGKQVLFMLPEIALSKQICARLETAFGFEVALWNSNISQSIKDRILLGVMIGSIRLVLGARSSVFLPYANLGLIVVDEEHDHSYKQDERFCYNARDMAVLRANISNIPVILGSATPSIESYHNTQEGKYNFIRLSNRFNDVSLPEQLIIDMSAVNLDNASKKRNRYISPQLLAAMERVIAENNQVLLFINKRGYAPLMLCSKCKWKAICVNCSATLVWHQSKNNLQCHYCGWSSSLYSNCLCCGNKKMLFLGAGVEKIAEEVTEYFPREQISIFTSDNTNNNQQIEAMLTKIIAKETKIIIGTQILAKGYNFPDLKLVGIIDADSGLIGGELKATENNIQLLQQVAGRAGRYQPGEVYIQTYQCEKPFFELLKSNNFLQFIEYELKERQKMNFPPFAKMISIVLTGNKEDEAMYFSELLVNCAPNLNEAGLRLLGPAPAFIYKVRNNYRFRILLLGPKKFNFQKYFEIWLGKVKRPSSVSIKINVDPYSLV